MNQSQETCPDPVASINEWSCTLACVEWTLKRLKIDTNQETMIHSMGLWFPEWFHRKGLTSPPEIITLLGKHGIVINAFVYVDNKKDAIEIINNYYPTRQYIAGFVLTAKPFGHCMAIRHWNGDDVTVMNPDRDTPDFPNHKWEELFRDREAKVFWLFQ